MDEEALNEIMKRVRFAHNMDTNARAKKPAQKKASQMWDAVLQDVADHHAPRSRQPPAR